MAAVSIIDATEPYSEAGTNVPPDKESKLLQALRHVVEGRRIVAQQRELIVKQRAAGRDTAVAETLLVHFENSLTIFEADLLAIQKASDAAAIAKR